jgi:hypothetical protein
MIPYKLRKIFGIGVGICAACCLGVPSMWAQQAVAYEIKHDVSLPVWALAATRTARMEAMRQEDADRRKAEALPAASSSFDSAPDLVAQASSLAPLAVTAGLNFDGVAASGFQPPDTNGVVGATQYVQWVNTRFAVYSKSTGVKLLGPSAGSFFWQGFGGPCQTQNQGDIVAQYDKAAARWVMTHRASQTNGPYLECVAVSVTSDATGSYFRYAFANPFNNFFTDYPKLAVWSDGYYFSADLQDQNNHFKPQGSMVCAFNRSNMLRGNAATEQCFLVPNTTVHSLLPSDLDGPTAPPAGSPDYFVNLDAPNNALDFWQFHVDWTNPNQSTFTGPSILPVAHFTEACNGGVCVPQLNTSNRVDGLGDRVMYRFAYRNFGTFESLLVTHSVNSGTVVGVRWYEIRHPQAPTLHQQGTIAPDSKFRWMPSIAQDKLGDIAVGYSVSNTAMYPAIRFTGRVPTDPLGTMEAEHNIQSGGGAELAGNNRWGDYTAMTVDPINDCTFWYTNEYYSTSSIQNWRTRIASFKFTNCH